MCHLLVFSLLIYLWLEYISMCSSICPSVCQHFNIRVNMKKTIKGKHFKLYTHALLHILIRPFKKGCVCCLVTVAI